MSTTTAVKTAFTYRLRPPAGLEQVLIKELKSLGIKQKPYKVPGRRIIEIQGPQDLLWTLIHKSRIAEDVQVRMT